MEDKVKEAQSALEKTTPAVEKATSALREGEKLIAVRQRFHEYSVAHRSGGPRLADNIIASDDEKRLFKAEQRAARKIKGQF